MDFIHREIDKYILKKVSYILNELFEEFSKDCENKEAQDILAGIISLHITRATIPDDQLVECTPISDKLKLMDLQSTISTSSIVSVMSTQSQPLLTPGDIKCSAILSSGINKGKMCGGRCKGDATMCGRHLKRDVTSVAITPEVKTLTKDEDEIQTHGAVLRYTGNGNYKCSYKVNDKICYKPCSKYSTKTCRLHLIQEKGMGTIVKDKFGNNVHEYSEMRIENGKVVGRERPHDGSLDVKLTEDDLECVDAYGLSVHSSIEARYRRYKSLTSDKSMKEV